MPYGELGQQKIGYRDVDSPGNRKDAGERSGLPGELGGDSQKGAVGYSSQVKGDVNRSRTVGGSDPGGQNLRGYVKGGAGSDSGRLRKAKNGVRDKLPRISPGG